MKYLILCYYFFRSLILRGPITHFRLLFGELYYERKYRIYTTGFKTAESKRNHHYQAASYTILKRLFKSLSPLAKNHAFYDIGCGKGRVLFMAAQFGFKNRYGIELDEALLKDTKANLQSAPSDDKNGKLTLIQGDVLNYTFENQASVYFLFNPFHADVMNGFIDKVLLTNKHACYFVYMNPIYSNVFTQRKIPIQKTIKSFLYTEAIIYRVPKRVE